MSPLENPYTVMQAIQTSFLSPTNHRPSRIKAQCDRSSLTVPWNYELSVEGNHRAAASALCAKFVAEDRKAYGEHCLPVWARSFSTGFLRDGSGVHVFV